MTKKKGSWQRNPLYSPELERRAREEELLRGWSMLHREPLVWIEDDVAGAGGRPPALTRDQIKAGIELLRARPPFATKTAAIHWLRHQDQKLQIDERIHDKAVSRHIVDAVPDAVVSRKQKPRPDRQN